MVFIPQSRKSLVGPKSLKYQFNFFFKNHPEQWFKTDHFKSAFFIVAWFAQKKGACNLSECLAIIRILPC